MGIVLKWLLYEFPPFAEYSNSGQLPDEELATAWGMGISSLAAKHSTFAVRVLLGKPVSTYCDGKPGLRQNWDPLAERSSNRNGAFSKRG